jgi:ribonuclease D
MTQSPAKPLLIDQPAAIADLVERLSGVERLALDTEGNSFHAYTEKVCLIQIAIPGAEFVVDPLATDVRPLGPILGSGATEVVLHGADFDVRTLKRDYQFKFARLFDTQLAARLLGRPETGLAAMVQHAFGVSLSKVHQRSDWGHRPLTSDQLAYAASDVRFLLPLRETLGKELAGAGKEAQAVQEFVRLAAIEPRPKRFDPEGFRRIRGARELEPISRSALRELYIAREGRAKATERPPFKVVGNDVLVEVARRLPRDVQALAGIRGLTPRMIERIGGMLVDAVRRGQEAATRSASR